MLRSFYIVTSSGILLVQKEYVQSSIQPRMLSSLLTALMELCASSTNLQISYIRLTDIAIAFAQDKETGIACVTLHSANDHEYVGRLFAQQTLTSFYQMYSEVDFKKTMVSVSVFQGFLGQTSEILKKCVADVLESMLITLPGSKDNNVKVMGVSFVGQFNITVGVPVEEVGLISNLDALKVASNDLAGMLQGDKFSETFIQTLSYGYIIKSLTGGKGTLICMVKRPQAHNQFYKFRTGTLQHKCSLIEALLN